MAGMTSNGTSPKRWRPRFSLRTLFIFVTLVCFYFGAWEVTKTFGVPAVSKFAKNDEPLYFCVDDAKSPLPFCVRVNQTNLLFLPFDSWDVNIPQHRRDYLWIFGWIVHSRDIPD